MADSLGDRLRQKAEEVRSEEQQARDRRASQEKANEFISEHARSAYEQFLQELQRQIQEVNSEIGSLPPFIWQGMMVQQGNCIASFSFYQPYTNRPENRLQIGIGTHPNAMYFEGRPDPIRYELQAVATGQLDGIVWTQSYGEELDNRGLAEFVLENLTDYYLQHKPGS